MEGRGRKVGCGALMVASALVAVVALWSGAPVPEAGQGLWKWREGGSSLTLAVKGGHVSGVLFTYKVGDTCPALVSAKRGKYLSFSGRCLNEKIEGGNFSFEFESDDGDAVAIEGSFDASGQPHGRIGLRRLGKEGKVSEEGLCQLAEWSATLDSDDPDVLFRGDCEISAMMGTGPSIGRGPYSCMLTGILGKGGHLPAGATTFGYELLLPVNASPSVELRGPVGSDSIVAESCTSRTGIIYGKPVPRETVTKVQRADGEPFPGGNYTLLVYDGGKLVQEIPFTVEE